MIMRFAGRFGFSLLEIVIAVAIFSTAIVAILGLMGPLTNATREVLDSSVAARLADNVDRELKRGLNFAELGIATDSASNPLVLYGTQDGSRVILHQDRLNLSTDNPPGILPRDRYFVLFIAKLNLPDSGANFRALVIRTEWPYAPQQEPATPPVSDVSRTGFAFHTAILP